MKTLVEKQQALERDIPLAKAMGATIARADGERVLLRAPLAPNSNHNGTAFGGSLHSLAVLAAWTLAAETLREAGLTSGYLVIQDSEIEYLEPIDGDFEAEASWPKADARERFVEAFRKRGIARAALAAEVRIGARVGARLRARYVAGPGERPPGR